MKNFILFFVLGVFFLVGTVQAATLVDRLKGRILLQVEENGEAWYVNPVDEKRYFLGGPDEAMKLMREQGLGISNSDLETITMDEQSRVALELRKQEKSKKELTEEKVKGFIADYLLPNGENYQVELLGERYGLYQFQIEMNGTKIDSYATKDGKYFFPSFIDIDGMIKENTNNTSNTTQAGEVATVKSDRPELELFVMSHCPFGVQIEKGILPVVDTLGDLIDFDIKFVDYAMHGKKEIDEQLSQYCMQKNESDKYLDYLKCFLEDADSSLCRESVEIDQKLLNNCIQETDEEYGITEDYNDENTWRSGRFPTFSVYEEENQEYGVAGSPTLVLNGQKINSARDSASLLATICSAFETKPSECNVELSNTSPSAGFGYGGEGYDSSAACGS